MNETKIKEYIREVLQNIPSDWLRLTTHRLDVYDESRAKVEFLEQFEALLEAGDCSNKSLSELPTAFDYIRLGHPLSCVLEWTIAKLNGMNSENVVCFSSQIAPVLAVLRKNLFEKKNTLILSPGELPKSFDQTLIRNIYGYNFEVQSIDSIHAIPEFNGSTILVSKEGTLTDFTFNDNLDFLVNFDPELGSIIAVSGDKNAHYVSEIQHVRRRETIAMTPADCHKVLNSLVGNSFTNNQESGAAQNKTIVENCIREITASDTKPFVGSSGLSVQYAIMMGLIDYANEHHNGKNIKFIVPPNCYGGTNDQARRVAACLDHVEVMDLPVDGGKNMVQSVDSVLERVASEDAVPFIIVEIPTNPRVEVPDLVSLNEALTRNRKTKNGTNAIDPVFVLDQTFCPNYHFLGEDEILSNVRTIAYVSGSKFPSGGLCTAGYCTSNLKAAGLMEKIGLHLTICDNKATDLQMEILAKQLPSMNQRIADAFKNTREFVEHIRTTLPDAKINFVSDELAAQGFTPSVFSLDLPTKGETHEERENYKRSLNHKLINMMITEIPDESKYCVSYGQLKGCYWTIPATSTQGTTKEGDKDYIARVALSPDMDLEKHKEVFEAFVSSL